MWTRATAPGPSLAPATVAEYDDAQLSAYGVRRGRRDPLRYMTGAVYAGGELVAASQRSGGHRVALPPDEGGQRGDFVRADDAPRWTGAPQGPRVRGRWLYGGHWMGQFGHFLTETLTSLWPSADGVDGIVLHRFLTPDVEQPWQRELLRAAGRDLPVLVVSEPCVVEHLVVPTRAFAPNRYASPECVDVWDALARTAREVADPSPAPRLVYLTRTSLPEDPRRLPDDDELDDAMSAVGFHVVAPEHLPVVEQVALATSAEVLAGASGSALHLSCTSGPGTSVLSVGDARTPDHPVPTQEAVDARRGRLTAFVPARTTRFGGRDVTATRELVERALDELPRDGR